MTPLLLANKKQVYVIDFLNNHKSFYRFSFIHHFRIFQADKTKYLQRFHVRIFGSSILILTLLKRLTGNPQISSDAV
jgi:hypothetical protein